MNTKYLIHTITAFALLTTSNYSFAAIEIGCGTIQWVKGGSWGQALMFKPSACADAYVIGRGYTVEPDVNVSIVLAAYHSGKPITLLLNNVYVAPGVHVG